MLKQSLPYIIALTILVLLFSLLGYPLSKKKNEAQRTLADKLNTLNQIYSSSTLPSKELINAMEKDNATLTDEYKKLREKLPVAEEFSLPEKVNLPLFFLEEFKNAKERIRAKAKEKGTALLTESLGLPSDLPSDGEAPQLIKDLYITEMMINLLLDMGLTSIDDIVLGEINKTDMYEDIPLILSVKCDMTSLTKFLYTLENTDQVFFIVKDFSLASMIKNKESVGTSNVATNERPTAGRFQNQPAIETREVAVRPEEKSIKVDLTLSVIRWRGL